MHFFRTTELETTKTNLKSKENFVLTDCLAFTNRMDERNKNYPFVVCSSFSNFLLNNELPLWANNILNLFCPGAVIVNFNLPNLKGWYHFPQSITKLSNQEIASNKLYLAYNNKFPITRFKDLENFNIEKYHSLNHSFEYLKTGWPLEIYITNNTVEIFSLKKNSHDLDIINHILPAGVSFKIVTISQLISGLITNYKLNNLSNPAQFIFKESFPKINIGQSPIGRLCLGSLTSPETIHRNFISNLANLEARLPDMAFKILHV